MFSVTILILDPLVLKHILILCLQVSWYLFWPLPTDSFILFFSFLWFCHLYFNYLFVLIFTLYIPQDWTMIYLFRKHVFKLQVFFNLWKSVFLLPILYAWISYWQLRKLLYSFKCLASIYCVIVLAEIVSQSRHLKKEKINIIIARIFGHTWYSQLFFTRHHYD